jgi:hypothetical protein
LFPPEAALFDDDCLCDQLKNDAAHEGCFPSDFPRSSSVTTEKLFSVILVMNEITGVF